MGPQSPANTICIPTQRNRNVDGRNVLLIARVASCGAILLFTQYEAPGFSTLTTNRSRDSCKFCYTSEEE